MSLPSHTCSACGREWDDAVSHSCAPRPEAQWFGSWGPDDTESVGWIVVGVTLSNGRRWYESRTPGVGATRNVRNARVWTERDQAERWAAMCQRDAERGGGHQRFHVEARALDNGQVKVDA